MNLSKPAPPTSHFAQNLRTLCDSNSSIAEICQRTGISRQQFSKYLSGKHEPSKTNLDRICEYFDVEISDLHLPPARFNSLFVEKYPHLNLLAGSQIMAKLLGKASQSRNILTGYCGIYERYQLSSIYRGQILKSIAHIYEKDGAVLYQYIERFQDLDQPTKARYVFKFRGICTCIDGRIYMGDFESVTGREISFTILTPQKRSNRELLFGLTMGVTSSISREPFAARVALQYCGTGPLTANYVRRSRTYDPTDSSIPVEVREYLNVDAALIRGT